MTDLYAYRAEEGIPDPHPSVANEAQELLDAWRRVGSMGADTPTAEMYREQAEEAAFSTLMAYLDDNDLLGSQWDPSDGGGFQ